jgi:cytochrome o ubiquinol oxidase subunit 1
MPKNTGMGLIIAVFGFLIGFALIWHIWWLAAVSLIGVITGIIIRISEDETEYTIPADELKKLDKKHKRHA